MFDDDFDADDILRDIDSEDGVFLVDEEEDDDDEMRELNFGTRFDENKNFSDMASDLDTAEDMWE